MLGITTKEKIKEINLFPILNPNFKQYDEEYNFENQYTPESWLNGKTQTTVEGKVDGYSYTINDTEEPTVRVTNNRIYKMLFGNVEESYWLASHGIYGSSGAARCGISKVIIGDVINVGTTYMFSTMGINENYLSYGVRPVIVLKSEINKTQVRKIDDKI